MTPTRYGPTPSPAAGVPAHVSVSASNVPAGDEVVTSGRPPPTAGTAGLVAWARAGPGCTWLLSVIAAHRPSQ